MKKNSTRQQSPKASRKRRKGPITIGMDLGDKTSRYCVLDEQRRSVAKKAAWRRPRRHDVRSFGTMRRCRIAIEVGTHSPWVSRLLNGLGT